MSLQSEAIKIAQRAIELEVSITKKHNRFLQDMAVARVFRVEYGRNKVRKILGTSNQAILLSDQRVAQTEIGQELITACIFMFVGEFAPLVSKTAFSTDRSSSRWDTNSDVWNTPNLLNSYSEDLQGTPLRSIPTSLAYPNTIPDDIYKEDQALTARIRELYNPNFGLSAFFVGQGPLSKLTPIYNVARTYFGNHQIERFLAIGRLFQLAWNETVLLRPFTGSKTAKDFINGLVD